MKNFADFVRHCEAEYPHFYKIHDKDGRNFRCVISVENHGEWTAGEELRVVQDIQRHRHIRSTELWRVVQGVIKLTISGKELMLNEGDQITIEPGEVHSATGEKNALVRVTCTPALMEGDEVIDETPEKPQVTAELLGVVGE